MQETLPNRADSPKGAISATQTTIQSVETQTQTYLNTKQNQDVESQTELTVEDNEQYDFCESRVDPSIQQIIGVAGHCRWKN